MSGTESDNSSNNNSISRSSSVSPASPSVSEKAPAGEKVLSVGTPSIITDSHPLPSSNSNLALCQPTTSTTTPHPPSVTSNLAYPTVALTVQDLQAQQLERDHILLTKVKNVQTIRIGQYEVEAWYYSPYPLDYCGLDKLYICQYCLKYMR